MGGDFARAGGLWGLLLYRFVCLGVWLGVVDFGRLSRFLLMGSYRFWIVGVGWQWFVCLLVMWFSWADGFGLQYDALVGLVGRRCLPVFLFRL